MANEHSDEKGTKAPQREPSEYEKLEREDEAREAKAEREAGEPIAREFLRSQHGAQGDKPHYGKADEKERERE